MNIEPKLIRLKEGLTDKKCSLLAHSLYTATDMTYAKANSLIKAMKIHRLANLPCRTLIHQAKQQKQLLLCHINKHALLSLPT